ncbi:endonuclease-reverse transcriptase [Elysia marginata]|uniref:Endonuclease-reverse transcriptase n=1 Tax=Elysia marginata TaxID=1093978 RepID=A0AAV4JGF6_9GAST|nr:endonuclease-reverse transcriptase [Elysia marginata]
MKAGPETVRFLQYGIRVIRNGLQPDQGGQQPETQKPIEGPPILKAKVEKTINDMKNGKAAGPDQIPIELLQALGNWGIDQLTKLLNRIYDTGNIPKDMLISTFIRKNSRKNRELQNVKTTEQSAS